MPQSSSKGFAVVDVETFLQTMERLDHAFAIRPLTRPHGITDARVQKYRYFNAKRFFQIEKSEDATGVVILAHSLRKTCSRYPLLVLYTEALAASSVAALEKLQRTLNLIIVKVDPLLPPREIVVTLIAERFRDTWTKLRVFELTSYDRICYLDADMLILKSMDSVFDVELPGDDWLAATPVCCCNLDNDTWAPHDWTAANCPYTPQEHPEALSPDPYISANSIPTYHLLNGGTFVFQPSSLLWEAMLRFFETTPLLSSFKFPDQDFMAAFFHRRWVNIGWQYNALKTMRYWHPNIWRDDEVRCLHYIVDKPWAKRVGTDGIAGYLGKDGETHQWWWDAFEKWTADMEKNNKEAMLLVEPHVAAS